MNISSQKRQNFRIVYTPYDHPNFQSQGEVYAILDISVGGIGIQMESYSLPATDAHLSGTIVFQNKDTQKVAGKILRIDAKTGQVVIAFDKEIPANVLMLQHRLWIKKGKA